VTTILVDDLELDYNNLIHFTPTAAQRKAFAKSGAAMPDGSFYITNAGQLSDAISAVGRATPNAGESETARRNSVRRHIMKRARALQRTDMIPDTWNSDGSLKQSGIVDLPGLLDDKTRDWLEHFGVKGMRWGVRRESNRPSGSGAYNPAGAHHPSLTAPRPNLSSDAARAKEFQSIVNKHGTRALTNQELGQLVTRLSLERQYTSMNPKQVSAGRKFTNELLKVGGNVAKQTATAFAAKYATQGLEILVKRAAKK
jgi:hypothetical protein